MPEEEGLGKGVEEGEEVERGEAEGGVQIVRGSRCKVCASACTGSVCGGK